DQLWLEFNNGSPPPLFTAFGQWIGSGKPDDSPQNGPLLPPTGLNNPPPAFPTSPRGPLFLEGVPKDDGRRVRDGRAQGVPLAHVPANFWATSQIFLYDEFGQFQDPMTLNPGLEYYVSAVIGNSSMTGTAGRAFSIPIQIKVSCDAQC